MLRFLQREKSKKGFTIIELIVVIAVLGVLMAVIMPAISQRRSRITEARSAAKDFYAAIQSVMNYYAVYNGQLLSDDAVNSDVVRFYKSMGGNFPFDPDYEEHSTDLMGLPDETAMYIFVAAKNNNIEEVGIVTRALENTVSENGMFQLLKRGKRNDGTDDGSRNTEFGEILKGEINHRISFNDGYYYAKVVFKYRPRDEFDNYVKDPSGKPINPTLNTMKVEYTAFCRGRELPDARNTTFEAFVDSNLRFGQDYVLNMNGGEVCGTCAVWDTVEVVGPAGAVTKEYTCVGLEGTTLT